MRDRLVGVTLLLLCGCGPGAAQDVSSSADLRNEDDPAFRPSFEEVREAWERSGDRVPG